MAPEIVRGGSHGHDMVNILINYSFFYSFIQYVCEYEFVCEIW